MANQQNDFNMERSPDTLHSFQSSQSLESNWHMEPPLDDDDIITIIKPANNVTTFEGSDATFNIIFNTKYSADSLYIKVYIGDFSNIIKNTKFAKNEGLVFFSYTVKNIPMHFNGAVYFHIFMRTDNGDDLVGSCMAHCHVIPTHDLSKLNLKPRRKLPVINQAPVERCHSLSSISTDWNELHSISSWSSYGETSSSGTGYY